MLYEFTCVVSKQGRSTSVSGSLLARSVQLPSVSVDGLPSGLAANPDSRIVLSGASKSPVPGTLSTQWVQTAGPPVSLSDPNVRILISEILSSQTCAQPAEIGQSLLSSQTVSRRKYATAASSCTDSPPILAPLLAQVVATSLASSSLVFRPNALQPGTTYSFALVARDASGNSSARVTINTSPKPHGVLGRGAIGVIQASAPSGVAFATKFSLSAGQWADEDGPLEYQYEYTVDSPDGGEEGSAPVILSRFSPTAVLEDVTLPPGLSATGNTVNISLCVHRNAGPAHCTLLPASGLPPNYNANLVAYHSRRLCVLLCCVSGFAGSCATATAPSPARPKLACALRRRSWRMPSLRQPLCRASPAARPRCALPLPRFVSSRLCSLLSFSRLLHNNTGTAFHTGP